MAKPIKETPVLKGKDAQAFLEKLFLEVSHTPSLAEQNAKALELERMKTNYNKLQSILQCAF